MNRDTENLMLADPLAESEQHFHQFISRLTAGVKHYPFEEREALVHEVRVLGIPSGNLKYPPSNVSGFFDLSGRGRELLWNAISAFLTRPPHCQPEGIYITINPVDPNLLALANNTFKNKIACATDKKVLTRNFFFVDADPLRLAKISATKEEKAAAFDLIEQVRQDLVGRGFPSPMLIDSGNGYHAWFPIDLPGDDGGRIEQTLKALARRHDTPKAKVDTTVFNASRICKIPGTWARKGDSLGTRPHRMCKVLEAPPWA